MSKEHAVNQATKQGRELLKQYLQEISSTDTIVDVRTSRLRTLLGLKQNNNNNNNNSNNSPTTATNPNDLLANALNAKLPSHREQLQLQQQHQQQQQITDLSAIPSPMPSQQTANNNNNVGYSQYNGTLVKSKALKLTAASDQPADELSSQQQSTTTTMTNSNGGTEDMETEDALKEFAFLSNESNGAGGAGGGGGGGNNTNNNSSDDWNVDKSQLSKLTEQYKRDRQRNSNNASAASSNKQQQQQQQQVSLGSHAAVTLQRPSRQELQTMIATLTNADGGATTQSSTLDSTKDDHHEQHQQTQVDNQEQQQQQQQQQGDKPFLANNAKLFLNDDCYTSDANLGDLSRIDVANSSSNTTTDETIISDVGLQANKRLRFDSIHSLILISVYSIDESTKFAQSHSEQVFAARTFRRRAMLGLPSTRSLAYHRI